MAATDGQVVLSTGASALLEGLLVHVSTLMSPFFSLGCRRGQEAAGRHVDTRKGAARAAG